METEETSQGADDPAVIDATATETDGATAPEPVEPDEIEATISPDMFPERLGAVGSALPGLPVVPSDSEMRNLAQLANTLANADAVPKALRRKPNDVFLVLLSARDLGVTLTAAMREFHVIEGKVTLSPKVKLGLVRQAGLGRVWPDPANDNSQAVWFAERHDAPGIVFESKFGWSDATLAQLVDDRCTPGAHWVGEKGPQRENRRNRGGESDTTSVECFCKVNYKKYPQRMLSWRAAGYLLDDVFPEIGTGLYSPDELGAVTNDDGEPIEVRAVESLPGMKGGGHREPEAEKMTDEVRADLTIRLDKVRAHPEAAEQLSTYWKDRDLPPFSQMVTAGHARLVLARVRHLETVFDLDATPDEESPENDATDETPGQGTEPENDGEATHGPGETEESGDADQTDETGPG